ncbi:ABC transporter permease [Propionibacteriaceae bacterium Y1700]|uniref:ABC transporter permease n=1 Tax=Microlunatus sp. Y1700 TaxID=3418487 RepID=UPI003DA760F4
MSQTPQEQTTEVQDQGVGESIVPTAELNDPTVVESADARRQRLSVGVLVALVGLGLVYLLTSTTGAAKFALSDAFDELQLPTITVPGVPTVTICAVLCLIAGAAYLSGRVPRRLLGLAGAVAGAAVVIGFLTWAAAGRDLPFPVSNQLAGTLTVATPLILGALCGVLCERAGVVNVSIEGQFLAAAFTAAVVGSVTQSVPLALVSAAIAGAVMGALLALFALKYVVNQVVLGVVLNLLASGLTGFIFDQLVQPRSSDLNSAPLMQPIAIPGLAQIPFFGRIFFQQTILAYLAGILVVVVWFVLFHTPWGLRVRAVGEHPQAADTVGIRVNGIRWSAVIVGGMIAGLGGAFFTIGSTGSFVKDLTVGNGFIALAALIMGRWHPVWAAVMALFFGFVTQMASQMQTLSTPVPSQFLLLLPYVATIIAVAGLVGRVRAPAADGIPYEKA